MPFWIETSTVATRAASPVQAAHLNEGWTGYIFHSLADRLVYCLYRIRDPPTFDAGTPWPASLAASAVGRATDSCQGYVKAMSRLQTPVMERSAGLLRQASVAVPMPDTIHQFH